MNDLDFNFSWDDLSKNLQANASGNNFKKFEKDTRFWKLSKNEAGDGAALIRLLPDADGKPFVKLLHYGIKKGGNGKPMWFIANSPESIGLPCPVKEHYMSLKAEGTTEADKEAEKFKRQTKFIANIMVVKDPSNPDNDGKVFLWEFGTKMKDKILAWLNPSDEEKAMGEEGKALFNPLMGNNIKLKIKKQGEFFTYDGTEVAPTASSLFETKDEAVEFIGKTTYKLDEFLQPEFYESYDELKTRFNRFIGGKAPAQEDTTPPQKEEASQPTQPKPNVSTPVDTAGDDESWLDDL